MVLSDKEFDTIIKNIASQLENVNEHDKEVIVESSLKKALSEEKLNDKNCVSDSKG